MSWNVASYSMSWRFAVASRRPAPPLRANASSAVACSAVAFRAAAAAAAGSISSRKSISARRSSRPMSGATV
jgi:hypothetical protein